MMNVFLPLLDWSAFRRNDEDPQGYPLIIILGQSIILGNDRPKRVVARTLTPTGARQLIGCTGSVYFRVASEANSFIPSQQDAHIVS